MFVDRARFRHIESPTHPLVKGHITKQGCRLVRWAAVEAVQKTGDLLKPDYQRIAERRNNRRIASAAVPAKIVSLVYDGCVTATSAASGPIRGVNKLRYSQEANSLTVMAPFRRSPD